MKPNPYLLIVIIILVLVEAMFAVGLLGMIQFSVALTIALPVVLTVYASVDCARIALRSVKNIQNWDRQLLGLAVLLGYLFLIPILPTLVMWGSTSLIQVFSNHPQPHLLTLAEAYRVALSLAIYHGILILNDMPGSMRAIGKELFGKR